MIMKQASGAVLRIMENEEWTDFSLKRKTDKFKTEPIKKTCEVSYYIEIYEYFKTN